MDETPHGSDSKAIILSSNMVGSWVRVSASATTSQMGVLQSKPVQPSAHVHISGAVLNKHILAMHSEHNQIEYVPVASVTASEAAFTGRRLGQVGTKGVKIALRTHGDRAIAAGPSSHPFNCGGIDLPKDRGGLNALAGIFIRANSSVKTT